MIPTDQWLDKAKRLAVGMRQRVQHLNERRPNLVIGNDLDSWWCYCHACHEGGIVEKSHVLLGATAPVQSELPTLPTDIVRVHASDMEVPIERFLASKNMSTVYLPYIHYSASRNRLMLEVQGQWHGRDLTGRSPQKWMNYGRDRIVGVPFTYTAVVEDLFSMFKVRWAMREYPNFTCMCNLGTEDSTHIAHALYTPHVEKLGWFFDADAAGDNGAAACMRRLRPVGMQQYRVRPPEGSDPKDMTCGEIRNLLKEVMQL